MGQTEGPAPPGQQDPALYVQRDRAPAESHSKLGAHTYFSQTEAGEAQERLPQRLQSLL